MLDKKLLDILACPSCGGEVKEKSSTIICLKCGLQYPIKNGIPVMLVDKAKKSNYEGGINA